MKAIVCVDKNWTIGQDEKLLFNIKEDMMHFKNTTINKICIMGYKTFESLPNGPLNNRTNIVLSTTEVDIQNAIVCADFQQLKILLKQYDTNDVYVIGGQQTYQLLLPFCDETIVTKIEIEKNGNKYFPNIEKSDNWLLKQKTPLHNSQNLPANILYFVNKNVKSLDELNKSPM